MHLIMLITFIYMIYFSFLISDTSAYPLAIVLVGVGDGPWEDMRKFDDKIPARDFDNFQV